MIKGYSTRLDANRLGVGLRATTRVNLNAHGESMADDFMMLFIIIYYHTLLPCGSAPLSYCGV